MLPQELEAPHRSVSVRLARLLYGPSTTNGPKATAVINGRTRIFDGLNDTAASKVKNVSYQAYTQQLKDILAYAQQNVLQFNLYVRGGANATTLSGPLRDAIATTPGFNLEFIP